MQKILYVEMDVHQASIVIVVLNVEGKTISEAIIETMTETVRDFRRGLRGELHVTFEEGAQAAWLYDLLRPHATEVLVCNPRHNKLLGVGNKSDRIDAMKLAQLQQLTGAVARDTLLSEVQTNRQTRAEVLRAVVEHPDVDAVEYRGAFVAMQYFGYLRRDPEPDGFNAWLNYLDSHPEDFRTMVHGVMNSVEYRLRFGAP